MKPVLLHLLPRTARKSLYNGRYVRVMSVATSPKRSTSRTALRTVNYQSVTNISRDCRTLTHGHNAL